MNLNDGKNMIYEINVRLTYESELDRKLIKDINRFPEEECYPQYKSAFCEELENNDKVISASETGVKIDSNLSIEEVKSLLLSIQDLDSFRNIIRISSIKSLEE
ncbi:hypothetical protein [Vibrio sp. SCSIO 43137]|uniref:hypothetical protein n=1 Tax=Vibrio sp. SCSIO 43137 TaxID=3021011 RepID=UPI00230821C4|nr:hypothetical protein [Vibrio sp. SCSIO 43137]WCE29685.1 hypothetical protein PK654_15490 [Vibrio sp. SCSIO 43137]